MSGKTATFMSRSTNLSRSISPEPSKCDHPPIMVLLHDKWTAVVPYETWETIVLFLNEVWILHCASKWFKTHFRTYITSGHTNTYEEESPESPARKVRMTSPTLRRQEALRSSSHSVWSSGRLVTRCSSNGHDGAVGRCECMSNNVGAMPATIAGVACVTVRSFLSTVGRCAV